MRSHRRWGGRNAGRALVVWGGWSGYRPREIASVFQRLLLEEGFEVTLTDALDTFKDESVLGSLQLIVPVWTMGKIEPDQLKPLVSAVEGGVGLAGCHG